nr:alpha/beta fold hydrolase [Fodinicola feengrottensis]
MTVEKIRRGTVEIAYESVGSGEPLLLIMGAGGSMRSWHPDFVRALADRGFRVIRFDNRDAGRSTRFTDRGAPNQLKMWLRPTSEAAYTLEDMAADAFAVLDANDYLSAHVAGVSLGGMIAQTMAIEKPDRVRTLTSISSGPSGKVGKPTAATLMKIVKVAKKKITSVDDFVEFQLGLAAIVGSPAYPVDQAFVRQDSEEAYADGFDLAASQRQTAAAAASGDRRERLSHVRLPTDHPRRSRPDGAADRGCRDREGDPGRAAGHLSGHGPRPAPRALAVDA